MVLLCAFKEYCALLFFKGLLLKDEQRILIQQTKNVQAARKIRFANMGEVVKIEHVVKACIQEAIAVEESGLQIQHWKTAEFELPDEFKKKLKEQPSLNKAFYALTPGRQRGYLIDGNWMIKVEGGRFFPLDAAKLR